MSTETEPTNPTARSLAERAVALKHWRWMDGASNQDGKRFSAEHKGFPRNASIFAGLATHRFASEADLPDLDDPATCGAVLQLLREAYPNHHVGTWQNECAHKSPGYPAASVQVYDPIASETTEHEGETLAEAAVKALEAAP
jgi:hypothetical protein